MKKSQQIRRRPKFNLITSSLKNKNVSNGKKLAFSIVWIGDTTITQHFSKRIRPLRKFLANWTQIGRSRLRAIEALAGRLPREKQIRALIGHRLLKTKSSSSNPSQNQKTKTKTHKNKLYLNSENITFQTF